MTKSLSKEISVNRNHDSYEHREYLNRRPIEGLPCTKHYVEFRHSAPKGLIKLEPGATRGILRVIKYFRDMKHKRARVSKNEILFARNVGCYFSLHIFTLKRTRFCFRYLAIRAFALLVALLFPRAP